MIPLPCCPRRAPPTRTLLGLSLLGLVACGRGRGDPAVTISAAGTSDPPRELRELITALTPPPATAVPVEKSEFFRNRKSALERLRGASEAHGREALRILQEEPPKLPEVRAGLLDVAAHTAPELVEPILVQLVTRFGEDLYVRKAATELLGECRPEKAIEVLDPILSQQVDGRTYPPEEHLLAAYIAANEELGLDPGPFVALIATDLERPQEVRHLATRALGKHPSPMSRQALESILTESGGNGYIRRLALQSLAEQLPKEDFCELALRIQSNEADVDFIRFLQDALDKRCR